MVRILKRVAAADGSGKEYIEAAALSTDSKPTDGIITGSVIDEVDTGKRFEFDETGEAWVEQPAKGGGAEVEALTVTQNDIYIAQEGKAYSPVTVNVPNTYAAGDEGKVVSNGALVNQSSSSVTENGTVDTTLINSLNVNVNGSSWVKLGETTVHASTTNSSTTPQIGSISAEIPTGKRIEIIVRDTAGSREGYFFGVDQECLIKPNQSSGSAELNRVYKTTAAGVAYNYVEESSRCGVYAGEIGTAGITIRCRYSGSTTTTIDGDYKVEVYYLRDYPPNGDPWNYTPPAAV